MITYGGRFKETLETYHGVPKDWTKEEIIVANQLLGGTFDLNSSTQTEPGAPSWLPDRNNWLQYRKTLYMLADGVEVGDNACIEQCIRYLELRYIGSYSGFIRARFARKLKSAKIAEAQKERLNKLFLNIVINRDYTEEFNAYVKLWCKIISPTVIQALQTFASTNQSLSERRWYANLIDNK